MADGSNDERQRARLADKELCYFETVLALSLEIIQNLKPVIHRIPSDDLDLVLTSIQAALYIRNKTISEEKRRKEEILNPDDAVGAIDQREGLT